MKNNFKDHKLSTILRRGLNIIMLMAFVAASVVGLWLQNSYQRQQAFSVTGDYIAHYMDKIDVEFTINDYVDQWMNYAIDGEDTQPKENYFDNDHLKRLVIGNQDYLSELSVVDKNGIVAYSSNPELLGFDIRDSEHTRPFLALLEGEEAYADPLYPSPYNDSFTMAYLGRTFRDKSGFMLFGINEDAYNTRNLEEIDIATVDVKIGITGFLINCDLNKKITAITATMAEAAGEDFAATEVLPENEGEIKESVAELYGKKCYVTAKREHDFYVIAAYPVDEADQFKLQNNILFVVLYFMILASFFIAFFLLLKKLVIKEIESTHVSLKKITDGDLDEKVDAGGSLEFEELSQGINETVDKLKDMIKAEEQRVRDELENARNIQISAVPGNFPPYPEDERFGLFASMNTAEAVGGDFYDFFMTDENTLVMVMADVSGKGMPAALYMMRAKTLIRTYAEEGLPVEEVAALANQKLCEDRSAEMFVTAWIGFLDLKTGVISYVHAGHTFPVIVSPKGAESVDAVFVKQKINMVLGGLKKAKYVRQEITLKPGDSIFLYTDGVTEAKAVSGDMYGEDRLLTLLKEKTGAIGAGDRNEFCRAACAMVYEGVSAFYSGAEQYDDITMMWVRL